MIGMSFDINKGLIAIYTGSEYEVLDLSWVQTDSISSTPDQVLDKDIFTNAKGYLRRTVLEHTRSKWEANTTVLTEHQINKFINLLNKGFKGDGECSASERKLKLRYYNEWKQSYVSGYYYVPDITFQYKTILNGKLMYQPIRFAFVEY